MTYRVLAEVDVGTAPSGRASIFLKHFLGHALVLRAALRAPVSAVTRVRRTIPAKTTRAHQQSLSRV
jgi:hypothetical protein